MSGLSADRGPPSKLDHPVIDIDGHTVEFFPALGRRAGQGGRATSTASRWLRRTSGTFGPIVDWYALTPEERAERRVARGPVGQRRHGARASTAPPRCSPACSTSASPSSASTSA